MREDRGDSTFRLLKKSISKPNTSRKTIKTKENGEPVCPKCGSRMRLIKPQRNDHWKAFWGCSKYKVSGCKGAIDA
jgi:ssDNA-binding Zn-finger/Zn-ribbon topoisomerase 1